MLFFILSIIGLAIVVGLLYWLFPSDAVLWFGGATLMFWIMDKLRQQVEDNFFINGAVISFTSIFCMIPYFFIDSPMLAFLLFMWCSVNLSFQVMTHSQYFTGYVIRRDYDPIWSSSYIRPVKQYFDYVASESNRAVIIFALIGFNGAMALLGGLIYSYGLWYVALPPVFVVLCNVGTLIYMHITAVTPPTGYSDQDWADNMIKGYGYVIGKVFGVIFAIVSAPFMLIIEVFRMIKAFFEVIREGGTERINIFYWICTGVLFGYCMLGVFGVSNFVEEFFESIGVFDVDLIYKEFYLTQLVAGWEFGETFFGAIFLFIPFVVGVILSAILEAIATLLTVILMLLYWLVMSLLVFAFEQILPLVILGVAITFIVFYLIESDREWFDWVRAAIFAILSIGLTVLYILMYAGVIKVL